MRSPARTSINYDMASRRFDQLMSIRRGVVVIGVRDNTQSGSHRTRRVLRLLLGAVDVLYVDKGNRGTQEGVRKKMLKTLLLLLLLVVPSISASEPNSGYADRERSPRHNNCCQKYDTFYTHQCYAFHSNASNITERHKILSVLILQAS